MEGLIFDIKEMAVFDGPGIRTTVFLKGCPLRCQWCHNPEGISGDIELMVKSSACLNCGACVRVCPTDTDVARCSACGQCTVVCPLNLRRLVGQYYFPNELANLLLRQKEILAKNGGGVTFSGGEPLMQSTFLLETVALLENLHVAIETSGFASQKVFKMVVDRVNYVMMDIKMVDDVKHTYFCKGSNKIILENLKYLKKGETPFVIRVPLIPSVNNSDENFEATAKLLEGSQNLLKVELLPYQKTAGAKYAMLRRPYKIDFEENKEPYFNLEPFLRRGIEVSIL
ncbi:MAG: glycyl-radical enzyme activating protein [Sphaerochaetaceae bacterium]